jgi:hypothetical protein
VPTRVDTPAIPEDVIAGIAAAPPLFSYTNPINMLERYSDGNVELAQKHASLIWTFIPESLTQEWKRKLMG